MTDRELLDLAKKAAGIDWLSRWWNPLTDDGDALRLAVRLAMHLGIESNAVTAWCPSAPRPCGFFCETLVPDPYAATRRAIVRAAAAIGAQPSQGVK